MAQKSGPGMRDEMSLYVPGACTCNVGACTCNVSHELGGRRRTNDVALGPLSVCTCIGRHTLQEEGGGGGRVFGRV